MTFQHVWSNFGQAYIYLLDHYRVLRVVPASTFASMQIDWWCQAVLACWVLYYLNVVFHCSITKRFFLLVKEQMNKTIALQQCNSRSKAIWNVICEGAKIIKHCFCVRTLHIMRSCALCPVFFAYCILLWQVLLAPCCGILAACLIFKGNCQGLGFCHLD